MPGAVGHVLEHAKASLITTANGSEPLTVRLCGTSSLWLAKSAGTLIRGCTTGWQGEAEAGPPFLARLNPEPSSMPLNNFAANIKTQATASGQPGTPPT